MGAKTILVVDDEADIRASMQQLLEGSLDVRCRTAADGQQALDTMEEMEVDLLVTDYRMPGMDGLELLLEVARRHPGTPAILVTAFADQRVASSATRRGARFFPKPLDLQAFVATVDSIMSGADGP